MPTNPKDGPKHAADLGVDEDGGDQHQAGGGSSGDGAGNVGLSAGGKGWTLPSRVVFHFVLDILCSGHQWESGPDKDGRQ